MSSDKIVEIIKASFGWGLLALLAWLAWHIVHGEVTQANSYGLDSIIGGLIAMAGGYIQWAFSQRIPLEFLHHVESPIPSPPTPVPPTPVPPAPAPPRSPTMPPAPR